MRRVVGIVVWTMMAGCGTMGATGEPAVAPPCRAALATLDVADAPRTEALATRLAACGMYVELFERVVPQSSDPLLLTRLEERGFLVEAELVRYADAHRGMAFMAIDPARAVAALDLISRWLLAKGAMAHCGLLARAVEGGSEAARAGLLRYFEHAQCAAGPSVARRLLATPYRARACRVVGELGDSEWLGLLAQVSWRDQMAAEPRSCARALRRVKQRLQWLVRMQVSPQQRSRQDW